MPVQVELFGVILLSVAYLTSGSHQSLASYPGLQMGEGLVYTVCACVSFKCECYVSFNCDVCEWVGLNQ